MTSVRAETPAPVTDAAAWALDLSLVELLSTDVVSASLSEQSLAEAPAVIDVITQEQIQRQGYRTVGEALASVAGLDLISDQYQGNLGVRGVAGDPRGYSRIVKVMIDGQPVSFRPSGENFLGVELIPLSVIDHIEVIRGPASVLYGANAFLGVVHIITKRGYAAVGGSLGASYEAGPRVKSPLGEASIGQQLGDFSILLGAVESSTRLDGYGLVELPEQDHPSADVTSITRAHPSSSAYGRIAFDRDGFGTLTLDGNFQRLYRSFEFADWGVLTHDNRQELINGYGRLSYRFEPMARLSVAVDAAISAGGTGKNDHLKSSASSPNYIVRDVGYTGYDVTGTVSYQLNPRSSLTAGVDATWDRQTLLTHYTVTPSGEQTKNPPSSSPEGTKLFSNVGAFVNGTVYPLDRARSHSFRIASPWQNLGLSAGFRMDAHNIYGNNYNGRAGIVYDVAARHYVKALYGSSFRAPSSTQLFSNTIVPSGYVGNPDLKPERAHTFELAVGTSPIDHLTLRGNAFLTRIEDRVEIRRSDESSALTNPTPTNSTPITSKGFEAQLDYRDRAWDARLSYSFQASSYPKQDLAAVVYRTVRVTTDAYPSHQVKGILGYTFVGARLRPFLEGRYVSARLGRLDNNAIVHPLTYLDERYRLPAYFTVDLGIGSAGFEPWPGHETVMNLVVKNLLNTNYTFPGDKGFDIPGFERSVLLSVRQEL